MFGYGFVGKVVNDTVVHTTGGTWLLVEFTMCDPPLSNVQKYNLLSPWFDSPKKEEIGKLRGLDGWSVCTEEEFYQLHGDYLILLKEDKLYGADRKPL